MARDTELEGRLRSFVQAEIDIALGRSFGGSPGVYTNLNATVDRTGRLRFASGGGEVLFDFRGTPDSGGTIGYVAGYPMTFGTHVLHASGTVGAPTYQYSPASGSAFVGTALPIVMTAGAALNVVAPVLGTADHLYVKLMRAIPNTIGTA
jgi:hypothetical protein